MKVPTGRARWVAAAHLLSIALLGAVPRDVRAEVAADLDGPLIEKLTGAKGQLARGEGVFKVSVPRTDLKVTVAGSPVVPAQGLISWAAFSGSDLDARVMGDLVLTEDQVNPVMSVALESGLEVTALHNHFFWDSPRVMFMHIGGMGSVPTLATAVGRILEKIRATSGGKGEVLTARVDPAGTTLDPARIEAILRVKGASGGGVYKVVVGRSTSMDGMAAGNAMGVNTWASFAGSDDRAVVDGDFAVLESELQPVLKALRGAGIDIVAIHQHMTGESPRILFLHYWGVGSTAALARGLRAALDQTAAAPGARKAQN
ncbi:MAG TPA: DUF1259 domain-containing protein [Anaeromyxobacteraceae bacterium]|nr:DUF1259 domain-containing protein [Anaeromyxobacteraceae bacterium]